MGTVKDKNDRDLTEAEDIKKRWQNTQKNYTRKIWMSQTTQIVWLLTLSQTSWRVKSSESLANKASGGDGIPAELFKILKD